MYSKTKHSGFTLIELLVVIGIISVLATIGTISLGNASSQSRDSKRQADMQALSLGLRLYFVRTGELPTTTTASDWQSFIGLLGASGSVPPRSGEDYCYYRSLTANEFALVATDMETKIPVNAITDISGVELVFETSGDGNCYGSNGVNPVCGVSGSQPSVAGDDYCMRVKFISLF